MSKVLQIIVKLLFCKTKQKTLKIVMIIELLTIYSETIVVNEIQ